MLFAPTEVKQQQLGLLVTKPFSLWTKQSSIFNNHEKLAYHIEGVNYISGVKTVSLYLMELIFLVCLVILCILIELAKVQKGSILVVLVASGSETICTDEISLMVIYPPEKDHLIKVYSLMEREVPKDSWPPVGNSTFINLVLIKLSPISRCDYYTVCGDMDDILESKEVVEYEEVFREYREGALV